MIEARGNRPDRAGIPQPIGFELSYAARRNRLTIAVRLILAIPQLIVTGLLGIASGVVAVIGWFAALILGRLPAWAAEFQTGYLGWYVRVQAYVLLLVDAYPPFEMGPPPTYPLQVSVSQPVRLNRAAVFFRIILVIPAEVVADLAGAGLAIAGIPIWLFLLIVGRMPRSLFQAMASVLRFQARTRAYFLLLLTPAYPTGLFAEPLLTGAWEQPAEETIAPPPVVPAGSWPVMSVPIAAGAKVLVGGLLVLGLAYSTFVLPRIFTVYGFSGLSSLEAGAHLVTAHEQLLATDQQALDADRTCITQSVAFRCDERYDAAQGRAYAAYASTLSGIAFPRSSQGDAAALRAEAAKAAKAFRYVAAATSQGAFAAEVSRENLAVLAKTVQQDYARLNARLDSAFP